VFTLIFCSASWSLASQGVALGDARKLRSTLVVQTVSRFERVAFAELSKRSSGLQSTEYTGTPTRPCGSE
jgi:hypothetical protein